MSLQNQHYIFVQYDLPYESKLYCDYVYPEVSTVPEGRFGPDTSPIYTYLRIIGQIHPLA